MIYVDDAFIPYGRMLMCHIVSDTLVEELHDFAAQLGMKRSWFQDKRIPHYDISKGKRDTAIQLGAVGVDSRSLLSVAIKTGKYN